MKDGITRILLARHGGTTASIDDRFAGSSDVELSDEGRRQAAALGERLKSTHIDAAYCSDMHRAMNTADAVTRHHGLRPTTVPALREIDHGHWEGQRHKEVEEKFAAEYAAWSSDPLIHSPPGGESGLNVIARALPALGKIVADHPGQTVLVVSHKATNRLLLASLLGFDLRKYRDRLSQDLACLNILDFKSPSEANLVLMNDISHYSGR